MDVKDFVDEVELEIRLLGGNSKKRIARVSFDQLIINGRDLTKLPISIAKKKDLKSIHANRNMISEIPATITSKLSHIEILSLNCNQIRSIPDNISDLEALKKLDLSNNHIESISCEIAKLRNLYVLKLMENPIGKIPDNISRSNLIYVYLGGNNEINLDNLCQLSNLRYLEVSGVVTQIYHKNFDKLNLKELRLKGLFEETISECYYEIPSLESLTIDGRFKSMPDGIERLSNLKKLKIICPSLKNSLPEGISKLTKLETLNISCSNLRRIPDLSKMNNLVDLTLDVQNLEKIPSLVNERKMSQLNIQFGKTQSDKW